LISKVILVSFISFFLKKIIIIVCVFIIVRFRVVVVVSMEGLELFVDVLVIELAFSLSDGLGNSGFFLLT